MVLEGLQSVLTRDTSRRTIKFCFGFSDFKSCLVVVSRLSLNIPLQNRELNCSQLS